MNPSTKRTDLIKLTNLPNFSIQAEKGDHFTFSNEKSFDLKSTFNLVPPILQVNEEEKEEEDENKNEHWITEEELDDDQEMALLSDIIQGFSSNDPNVRQRATLRAESLMKQDEELERQLFREKNVSQTFQKIFNHNNNDAGGRIGTEDIYIDKKIEMIDFLQDLSTDELQYRKLTRSQRKQKSDGLKKHGNLAFSRKEYNEAVQFYTRAIDLIRDSPGLYTNRAFAYIKLGLYELALEDCEKAIFLCEFSLKARLYKCKILHLLQKHEECLVFLEETRKVMPFHKSAIDHCEKTLFASEAEQKDAFLDEMDKGQGDKSRDDIFSTEKYMRLASQFQITQMENFFEKNKKSN